MTKFNGFLPGAFTQLMIPPGFFSDFLPRIDNATELKLMLFCFWALPQKEGDFPYLRWEDFAHHRDMIASDDDDLERAVQSAVEHGGLLQADITVRGQQHTLYFVNTEKGRGGQKQVQNRCMATRRPRQPNRDTAGAPWHLQPVPR